MIARKHLPHALALLGSATILGTLVSYADPAALAGALSAFDWRLAPVVVGLVIADYAVRFLRWRLLFRAAAGRNLPLGADACLFLAGTAMTLTPARAGEWLKSVYGQRLHGVPAGATAPIPLVERIADIAAMALLATPGALLWSGGVLPGSAIGIALVAGLAPAAILYLSRKQSILSLACRQSGFARLATRFESLFEAARALLRPRPLAIAFGLGLLAWTIECVIFLLVLVGLGAETSVLLLVKASFIYPVATLAGTLSFLPGGFGVAEGSITALTIRLARLPADTAAAAALLVRAAIVGLGVGAGLAPLILLSRRALASPAMAAQATRHLEPHGMPVLDHAA